MKKLFFTMVCILVLPWNLFSQPFTIHKVEETRSWNDSCPLMQHVNGIVLHFTIGRYPGCRTELSRTPKKSAQFLVNRKGYIEQFVEANRIVDHAGDSEWNGEDSLSLTWPGIELEVWDKWLTLTPIQYAATCWLLDSLQRAFGIPDTMVLPHYLIATWYPNKPYGKRHIRYYQFYTRGRKQDGYTLDRKLLGLDAAPKIDFGVMMGYVVPKASDERLFFGKNFSSNEKKLFREKIFIARTCDSIAMIENSFCTIITYDQVVPTPRTLPTLVIADQKEKKVKGQQTELAVMRNRKVLRIKNTTQY